MTDYERFKSNNEYAHAIGLCLSNGHDVEYFCTPIGAKQIGTLGVDGIAFCFIDGIGDTVFCVSPSGGAEKYVFPIARSFTEFLSLTATVGNASTVEQIMCFDRDRFYGFFPICESVFCDKSAELAEFDLTRIDDPWSFIRGLSNRFNYDLIKFTDSYYDTLGLPNPRGKTEENARADDFKSTFTLEIKKRIKSDNR